ncbi:hypothetical protein Btru_073007 [Bulinus truncatus]|nr:hypothetical protein Btru_073007 [Bulinus truncatus]
MEVEDVEADVVTSSSVSPSIKGGQKKSVSPPASSITSTASRPVDKTMNKLNTVQSGSPAETKVKSNPSLKPIQKGVQVVGDFFGRMATLIVMVVTTINTSIVCVNDFTNSNYWSAGLHAFLLVFIHIPVIVVMVWLIVKAKVQAVYRKIRPGKPNETIVVTEINEFDGQTVEVKDDKQSVSKNKADKALGLLQKGEQLGKTLQGGHVNQAFG